MLLEADQEACFKAYARMTRLNELSVKMPEGDYTRRIGLESCEWLDPQVRNALSTMLHTRLTLPAAKL
jgi:hypothetical protein